MSQNKSSPHYNQLKKKLLEQHKEISQAFREKHEETLEALQEVPKNVAAGSLAGMLLLTAPAPSMLLTQAVATTQSPEPTLNEIRISLKRELKEALPQTMDDLSVEQKQKVGEILSRYYHLSAVPTLEGKELNRVYGIIGAEQHLMRYPGDTMASHFHSSSEEKFHSSGMAPGRGAWGYFAESASAMTDEIVLREKYYVAVQTFLSPGWGEQTRELYQFFKYRKMLVVNPENGKAVVAVIGDAGPAQWTGKHLGGSPETMAYLERQDGRARGPVLYYFIDDPEIKVPLGPITLLENYEK